LTTGIASTAFSTAGAEDARFGETPAAIITVAANCSDVDEAAVIAHCESLLSDYKVPRDVVLRSEPLPRLPSGKLNKRAIREEYHDVTERFTRAR
jgi:fatty-acyl-CoA synthase